MFVVPEQEKPNGEFPTVKSQNPENSEAFDILRKQKENGTLPKNGAVVKTIVTTELVRKIADDYNVETLDVLTGFKFIGEKIKEFEKSGEYSYIFGLEESFGYLKEHMQGTRMLDSSRKYSFYS